MARSRNVGLEVGNLRERLRVRLLEKRNPRIGPAGTGSAARKMHDGVSGLDSAVVAWIAEDTGFGNAIAIDESAVYAVGGLYGQYITVKYDGATGTREWLVQHTGGLEVYGVALDAQGNVFTAGYGLNGFDDELLTIKSNSQGIEQWAITNPRASFAEAVAVDAAGDAYVAGWGGSDFVTIKYDEGGALLWRSIFDGGLADSPNAMAVDALRNVYVAGYAERPGGPYADFATVKYSARGDELWVTKYPETGPEWSSAGAMILDGFGNLYVAGGRQGAFGSDLVIVKYDTSGTRVWVAEYDGSSVDFARDIGVDGSGNVYVCGVSGASSVEDFVTIKYNTLGDEQWAARYDGPSGGSDVIASMVVDGNGDVYVTGSSEGVGSEYDFATIKYDTDGRMKWLARYDRGGGFYDGGTGLALDTSGGVYVSGYSILGSGSYFTTIKYLQIPSSLPGPVVLSFPPDGAVVDNDSVQCSWIENTTPVDHYWLEWSTDSLFTLSSIDSLLTGTSGTIPTLQNGQEYWWRVKAHNSAGWGPFGEAWSFSVLISNVDGLNDTPREFSLSQNYPNPFNGVSNFEFRISKSSHVSFEIYDLLGNDVTTLAEEKLGPGRYSLQWDASGVPSGVYFYRLTANGSVQTRKLVLLR